MSIPFEKIRRFGCQIAKDVDIVWFETCCCQEEEENFAFLVVASGIEVAYQIVLEYKRLFELALRDHMIMEEGDQSIFLYSFVVRSHYGHTEFSPTRRSEILSLSLLNLSTLRGPVSLSELNRFSRSRSPLHMTEAANLRLGPVPGRMEGPPSSLEFRRPSSPRLSPLPSPSSRHMKPMSFSQVNMTPKAVAAHRSSSSELHFGMRSDKNDPSRSSAPCTLSHSLDTTSPSWNDQKKRKLTLADMSQYEHLKKNMQKKSSLAQIQKDGGIQKLQKVRKLSKQMDSAGGSVDNHLESLNSSPYYSRSEDCRGGVSLATYDHLVKGIENISVHRSNAYPERKKSSPAYVET